MAETDMVEGVIQVIQDPEKEPDEPIKPFPDQVIDLYEKCLQNALIISTSFKNVIQVKLDRKRRLLQAIFLGIAFFYVVPRYSFICFMYSKDQETRKYWEYLIPDYLTQFGLFGKALNLLYATFILFIAVDKLYQRIFESKGRLDYITNFDSLRETKIKSKRSVSVIELDSEEEADTNIIQVLGEEDKTNLLVGMKRKLILLQTNMKPHILSAMSYDLIACPLFIYNERPPLITTLFAALNMIIMSFNHYFNVHSVLMTYISYIMAVDYFSARINYMITLLKQNNLNENDVNRLLILYNQLMLDFKNQDYLLKFLLRNLIFSYCFILWNLFFLFTIDMNLLLRVLLLTGIIIVSSTMLLSGLNVGQLHSKTLVLYSHFHSLAARDVSSNNLSLKTKRNLLNCMKELGSQQTDGQFVMGLRDGHGAATSSLEIFNLTMSTISTTLMVLEIMRERS